MKPNRLLHEQTERTEWNHSEQPSVLVKAQEAEIHQRLAEMEADPTQCVPFAEADVEQMFKEIMDERTAKTSSRPR